MLPEEWPMADRTALTRSTVRGAGRGRLPTVRRDLFLDDRDRLSEQERVLMNAMLDCLVAEIADEIAAALPGGWSVANDDRRTSLSSLLKQLGLVDDETLIALLLRRAEEEKAAQAARSRANRRESRFLQSLVSHDNGPVAAAAMALVLARGRRRDRLGQCLITIDDLDSGTLGKLVAAVAAALRAPLASTHGSKSADEALAKAITAVRARQDEDRGIDRLTAELVALFDAAGTLDDSTLLAAAGEGEIAFLAHALGRRAGIDPFVAQDELLSAEAGRTMALLRMGGASRELAAGLIAGSGDWMGLEDEGAAIDLFDHMPMADVDAARAWLLAGTDYRAAAELVGRNLG